MRLSVFPDLRPEGQIGLPADFAAIGGAVDRLMAQFCKDRDRDDERIADLRLAVTEALNNVVEHSGHPTSVEVVVHYTSARSSPSWVCIEDRGDPLPPGLMGKAAPSDDTIMQTSTPPQIHKIGVVETAHADAVVFEEGCDLEALPEGGWGWLLIRGSVNTVDYVREDGVNYLLLQKQLDSEEAADLETVEPLAAR